MLRNRTVELQQRQERVKEAAWLDRCNGEKILRKLEDFSSLSIYQGPLRELWDIEEDEIMED